MKLPISVRGSLKAFSTCKITINWFFLQFLWNNEIMNAILTIIPPQKKSRIFTFLAGCLLVNMCVWVSVSACLDVLRDNSLGLCLKKECRGVLKSWGKQFKIISLRNAKNEKMKKWGKLIKGKNTKDHANEKLFQRQKSVKSGRNFPSKWKSIAFHCRKRAINHHQQEAAWLKAG